MKFAICNETWFGSGTPDVVSMLGRLTAPPPLGPKFVRFDAFARVCDSIARRGYDGVEVAPFTLCFDPAELDEADGSKLGGIARRAGIEVTGLHWLLLRPPGLHLTTPDDGIRRLTTGFAQHLAGICAAMGGKVMVWGSPKQRQIDPEWNRDDAAKRAADVLHVVCDTAGRFGITVAMEPLARTETNFLTTAEETIALIKRVNHPACRLHLDVKAMSDESRTIPDIIRASREFLAYFHANDPNLRGPGTGTVQFEPIFSALREVGYDGWVSVEVFNYTPDADTIAHESLAYLKQFVPQDHGVASRASSP